MDIRLYESERDYATLAEWYREYGSRVPAPEDLPLLGVVCDSAMMFLRLAEGKIGLLEAVVVKKGTERDEVLTALLEAIHAVAKANGLTRLLGYSKIPALVKRAEDLGWTVAPHKLLTIRV